MIQTVSCHKKSSYDTNSIMSQKELLSQKEFADSLDTDIHKSSIELSDLAQTKVCVHERHVIQLVLNLIIQ